MERVSDHASCEISEDVVLNYDGQGNLVGIEIDNVSTKEIRKLIVSRLPASVETKNRSWP